MGTRESDVVEYLVERTRQHGGEVRKVKWLGRHGAPDCLVMLPRVVIWVELKKPGEKAKPHQVREHEKLQRAGQTVVVIDSFEGVDHMYKGVLR